MQAPSDRSLRIAMLGPIAWRTPPVHYGPWEQVVSTLTPIQVKLAELEADPEIARTAMLDGAERARAYAAAKMAVVRERIGLEAF